MKKFNISDFSPHLFWDVDMTKIDWDEHTVFLVGRVLDYGHDKDWLILLAQYGIEKITQIAKELRDLDELSMHFVSTITKTPLNEFRCYRLRQSMPHYSGY